MSFAQDDNFTLKVMRPEKSRRLISVGVPVRVAAKATLRNRLRRRVSEAARLLSDRIRPGCRVVITVRMAVLPDYPALKDALVLLMKKSGILTP